MHPEALTISVLYGTGIHRLDIQETLESIPFLKILGQAIDPESFLSKHEEVTPDLILVDLDGTSDFPEWMTHLTQDLPQIPVLVCSHSREPDFLIRAMQMGIREFLPLPLERADMEAACERVWIAKKRVQPLDHQKGQVLVVTAHKGGAGTTTVAVNLAIAMAEVTLERVALVDLGRPFPDVANFLDLEATYTILDLAQNLSSLDHSFIERIMQPYGKRLSILHGCPDFKEQESIELEALDKIFTILRSLYRWTIVDLSHWLDDFFLHVLGEADTLLMLTDLTIPDLRNLKKLWPMLKEWYQVRERAKVVVNRFQKNNGLNLRDVEHVVHQPAYDSLPDDYLSLIESINQGRPLGEKAPRSKLWRSLQHLAQRLKEEDHGAGREEAAAAPSLGRKFWPFSKG